MREQILASIGVIGCGAISDVYFSAIARSPALHLAAVAARGMASAERQAARYGGEAVTVEALLADPSIDIVVNLTPAAEHFALNRRILDAGKHLYTEKPFVLSLGEAEALTALAAERSVRIGSAPDTFFGAAHQAARALVDQGAIGRVVHGAGFVGHPGIERFHPSPAGFYRPGSEPPCEIGPYYITQLVNLLGPVARVVAASAHGPAERVACVGPQQGRSFPVEVPTSFAAILIFEAGPFVTLTMSLDVARHDRAPLELYGTEGALKLGDPNFFGGALRLSRGGADWEPIDISDRPLGADNRASPIGRVADYRGAGIVDMAVALAEGRPHRTGPDLVSHCVEVMAAIMRASQAGGEVVVPTRCARPAPISRDADARFLSLVRSPHETIDDENTSHQAEEGRA